MTSQLEIPKSAKEAQAMLRQAGLPELTPSLIAEIVTKEGDSFKMALAQAGASNGDDEPSKRYLSQVITACVPATRAVLDRLGLGTARLDTLINISKAEGRTFAHAIRALHNQEFSPENAQVRQYLARVISPYVSEPPEPIALAAPQEATGQQHIARRSTGHTPPAQSSPRPAAPVTPLPVRNVGHRSSTPAPERSQSARPASSGANHEEGDRKFTSIHLYGGKAALCFSPDETRKGTSPTVRVEAAKASGPRQYDWSTKASFQLTVSELPLVFGVLYGLMPLVELSGHGAENEKSMSIEDQGGKFFFSLRVRGGTVYAIPSPAKDAYPIMTMLLEQMQKNAPGLPTAQIIQIAKRVCDMYQKATPAPQPRVANG